MIQHQTLRYVTVADGKQTTKSALPAQRVARSASLFELGVNHISAQHIVL